MTEPRPPFTPSPPLGAEKGGEGIYGRPQTGLELRTGCGVWVRVCVAAIETISTVPSYNE